MSKNFFGTNLDESPRNAELGQLAYWDLDYFRYVNAGKIRVITTDNQTAKSFETVALDTSAGELTLLLPADPLLNERVFIADAKSTWAENNGTLSGNGNNIMGATDEVVLNIKGRTTTATFVGDTTGWFLS